MPIYLFKCPVCGEIELESYKHVVCPECGSTIKRIFKPPGIIFKGSGFYSTEKREKS